MNHSKKSLKFSEEILGWFCAKITYTLLNITHSTRNINAAKEILKINKDKARSTSAVDPWYL